MGTDCCVVIERERNVNDWEPIGLLDLPRCYDLFDEMKMIGFKGYPNYIRYTSQRVLDTVEDWGEGYMAYNTFRKLLKKYDLKHLDVVKKKDRDRCRAIFRFDNRRW